MYSRSSFGSYYPVDSIISRLNPIVKLINFLITIVIIILTNSIYISCFLLIFLVLIMFLSLVPFRYYFNTFYSLRYIYLLIAVICAFSGFTLEEYAVLISKLIVFLEYLNILAFTTSPSESIYAIEKFLSLFNVFYLNVSKFAFKINSLIRYFPLYMSVKYKTISSSVSRGIVYNKLSIVKKIKLHLNIRRLTREKNKEIMKESELKLFSIKKPRTNYRTNKVSFNDIFFLLFHLLLLYACLADGGFL